MKVIKNRQIHSIDWIFDDQINSQVNIIFSYNFFEENKQAIFSRQGKNGVVLNGEILLETIKDDLNKLDLIALEFPVYTDGRCFSLASLLRNSYGYQGDLLAFGDILRDQVADLERCGFNLIKFSDHRDIKDSLNAFDELTAVYQPAADKQKTILELR